ncbi:MAG: hypothetical protein ACK5V3_04260 [Bdellovibrionales bacterium]
MNSKEADRLLAAFDDEKELKKRNAIASELDKLFIKNSYLIPLYHRREAIVMPQWLKGVTDSFIGTSYMTPENWSF